MSEMGKRCDDDEAAEGFDEEEAEETGDTWISMYVGQWECRWLLVAWLLQAMQCAANVLHSDGRN